jgi:hypothetical protein
MDMLTDIDTAIQKRIVLMDKQDNKSPINQGKEVI